MGYMIKVQKISRTRSTSYYANIPTAVVETMEIEKAEELEWILEDRELSSCVARKVPRRFQWYIAEGMLSLPTAKWSMVISFFSGVMASGFAFGCAKDTVEFFNAGIGAK